MLAKPADCCSGGNANTSPACALDGSPLPDVVEYIKAGKVDLVINIPEVCVVHAHCGMSRMASCRGFFATKESTLLGYQGTRTRFKCGDKID